MLIYARILYWMSKSKPDDLKGDVAEMKTIVCFGDSNTWGYNAATGGRFPAEKRWTGVLKRELSEDFQVIEEGLNGRTTVWDDPIEGEYKNGKRYLLPCLLSHKPVDLVIIMLGTNDLKKRFSVTPHDIASGAGVLAGIAKTSGAGPDGRAPRVLLISPVRVGNMKNTPFEEFFGGEESVIRAEKFPEHLKRVADRGGCEFLDAALYAEPSPIDAIHIEPSSLEPLGKAVAEKVKSIFSVE